MICTIFTPNLGIMLYKWTALLSIILASSCARFEYEPATTVAMLVWTDHTADEPMQVLVNGNAIGNITTYDSAPMCMSAGTVLYDFPFEDTLKITVLEDEVLHAVADIYIFKANTGQHTKTYPGTSIAIDGTSGQDCTQFYLSW